MIRWTRAVAVAFSASAILTSATVASASPAAPSQSHAGGRSSQAWLQSVGQFYLGDGSNPLIASLGGDCGQLMDGVFYMAAPIDVGVELECSVPTGTWIVLSPAAYFTTEGIDGTTDQDLEDAADAGFIASFDWLTLDGKNVPLQTIRTGAYDVVSEPGSFYDTILGVGTGPIRTALTGNVVLLHPMTPGQHVIESAVSFVNDGAFSATYDVQVG